MFQPPRCPYSDCPRHTDPTPRFFKRHGSYKPRCRPRPVPRFRCDTCLRTFSRQTFRMDRYDHKPHLNAMLLKLAESGLSIRKSAAVLGLSRRCTELKLRKILRHLRKLNVNLSAPDIVEVLRREGIEPSGAGAPQPLTPTQALSWRQEWGSRSAHPLSRRAESVEDWSARSACAASTR